MKTIALLLAALLLGIVLGRAWERFVYDDICLDMGGGRNPGDHPICVIERD